MVDIENKLKTERSHERRHMLYTKCSKLDIERAMYMIRADNKYKQIQERTYTWSPAPVNTGGRVSYWKNEKTNGTV